MLLLALIFLVTFTLLALGRLGDFHLPRGRVAFAGGVATYFVAGGSLRVIDFELLTLLLGLMLVAGATATLGCFGFPSNLLGRATPRNALRIAAVAVAFTSALMLNDAAVVVLFPILLPLLRQRGLKLAPAAAILAMAANIGSLLTPFGNPQNLILANFAGLSVVDFLVDQGLIFVVGMSSICLAVGFVPVADSTKITPSGTTPWIAAVPVLAFGAGIILSGLGFGPLGYWALGAGLVGLACVAFSNGSVLFVARGIDKGVLLLFTGFFLLTAPLASWFPLALLNPAEWTQIRQAAIPTIMGSNIVGNVPAVMIMGSLAPEWVAGHASFLVTLTTLGGTLLLTGSAATLLAAEATKSVGGELSFLEYLRWSIPTISLPLVVGMLLNW